MQSTTTHEAFEVKSISRRNPRVKNTNWEEKVLEEFRASDINRAIAIAKTAYRIRDGKENNTILWQDVYKICNAPSQNPDFYEDIDILFGSFCNIALLKTIREAYDRLMRGKRMSNIHYLDTCNLPLRQFSTLLCNAPLLSLKLRRFRRAKIGDEDILALTTSMKDKNCNLTSLDLSKNRMNTKEIIDLFMALAHPNCKLISINLSFNHANQKGTIALAQSLKSPHCKLTAIELTMNNIDKTGIIAIAEALQNPHCKLTHLDMRGNNIGDDGVKVLAKSLKDPHCKLSSIHLCANHIGDDGTKTIAEALQDSHCKLTSINLSINDIEAEGVNALAEALYDPNCKLTYINLGWNKMSSKAAKRFIKICMLMGVRYEIPLNGFNTGKVEKAVRDEILSHHRMAYSTLAFFRATQNHPFQDSGIQLSTEIEFFFNPSVYQNKSRLNVNKFVETRFFKDQETQDNPTQKSAMLTSTDSHPTRRSCCTIC